MCVSLPPASLGACVCLSCLHRETDLGLASHRASLSLPRPQPAVRSLWAVEGSHPAADWWGPGESCRLPLLSRGSAHRFGLLPRDDPLTPRPAQGLCPHLLGALPTWCSGVMLLSTLPSSNPEASCLPLTLALVNQGGQDSWGVTSSALRALRRCRRAPGKGRFKCVQGSLEQDPHLSASSHPPGREDTLGAAHRRASPLSV